MANAPEMGSEQPNSDILDCNVVEIVDMALGRLQNAGLKLIEWRAVLYRRFNVPIVVKNFSYLVEDDKLHEASETLSEMGLPLTEPLDWIVAVCGDFQTEGRFHRITRATTPGSVQHLVLYPISFSTLSMSEVYETPTYYGLPSPRCTSVLIPSPLPLYASLIRMMLRYPRGSSSLLVLRTELSELICCDFLELEDGYYEPEEPTEAERLDMDRRLASGAQKVKEWTEAGLWREGEEWMGEALHAVVGGTGDLRLLPWKW